MITVNVVKSEPVKVTVTKSAGDVIITYPTYTGSTSVIPTFDVQTLETEDTSVRENITVAAIPVTRTENESGTTVTIGG